ncbi:hypothetical protein Pelo_705 [Pelomyxa schiedti]|nr:hypothetical protein Pelo_705 [Pelomyxa schiedti]
MARRRRGASTTYDIENGCTKRVKMSLQRTNAFNGRSFFSLFFTQKPTSTRQHLTKNSSQMADQGEKPSPPPYAAASSPFYLSYDGIAPSGSSFYQDSSNMLGLQESNVFPQPNGLNLTAETTFPYTGTYGQGQILCSTSSGLANTQQGVGTSSFQLPPSQLPLVPPINAPSTSGRKHKKQSSVENDAQNPLVMGLLNLLQKQMDQHNTHIERSLQLVSTVVNCNHRQSRIIDNLTRRKRLPDPSPSPLTNPEDSYENSDSESEQFNDVGEIARRPAMKKPRHLAPPSNKSS